MDVRQVQHLKSISATHHIERQKKNHKILSMDDKINLLYMITTPRKIGIECNFLNLIKIIYKKHEANTLFNGEIPNVCPLNWGIRQERLLSHCYRA